MIVKKEGLLGSALQCAFTELLTNTDISSKLEALLSKATKTTDFLFEGAKNFDNLMGYKTKSLLAAPLINNFQEVIEVLQLINRIDTKSGEIGELSV